MKRKSFLLVAIIAALLCCQTKTFSQQKQTNFTALVEQAWKVVNDKYFDTSFNGLNWQQVRERLRLGFSPLSFGQSQKYSSQMEAHAAIPSMLQQLNDPAIRLLTPEQATAFIQEVSGASHSGIGLAELLSLDTSDRSRRITVVTPIPKTTAARAGLQPGDVIAVVDGVLLKG